VGQAQRRGELAAKGQKLACLWAPKRCKATVDPARDFNAFAWARVLVASLRVSQPSPGGLEWLEAIVKPRGHFVRITDLSQSPSGGGPWWLDIEDGASAVLHLGDPEDEAARIDFVTQVAALDLAEHHALEAPRVMAADLDGAASGHLFLLQTALPGSSRIPVQPTANRLRNLGRAAGAIHAVVLTPSQALPVRLRSLDDVDFRSFRVPDVSLELFARAHEFVDTATPPEEAAVFVHGDLWQGNTLWDGSRHCGTLDWDCAGVGPAGIDLGSLRCDVAVMYGQEAVDEVLLGWTDAHGIPAANVAWWDLVAALSTPPDLMMWLPNFHHQGRRDLDLATVTDRRDAFLRIALDCFA
jgi:aminoglycoside phosphotransferase (APT) family kinase protein